MLFTCFSVVADVVHASVSYLWRLQVSSRSGNFKLAKTSIYSLFICGMDGSHVDYKLVSSFIIIYEPITDMLSVLSDTNAHLRYALFWRTRLKAVANAEFVYVLTEISGLDVHECMLTLLVSLSVLADFPSGGIDWSFRKQADRFRFTREVESQK